MFARLDVVDDIKRGDFIAVTRGKHGTGKLPVGITVSKSNVIVGVAARDIAAGETITYAPGVNTDDILTNTFEGANEK